MFLIYYLIFIMIIILFIKFYFLEHFNDKNIIIDNYLWSKRVVDVKPYNLLDTEIVSSKNTIIKHINNCDKILWIRNSSKNSNVVTDLDHVGNNLNLIKKPIILITSDGDRSVPSSYKTELVNKILNSKNILKWYTQNYDKSIIHPKLDYYPIGLDLHCKGYLPDSNKNFDREKLIKEKILIYHDLRKKYNSSNKKINKIFCDAHLRHSHPSRPIMYEKIKNNKLINFQNERVKIQDIFEKFASHRFVLSPRGNGLDCHRTWEIFLLGSIVITETSSLDQMYIDNNLPVIILNDYNELNNYDINKLNELYNLHKNKCIENNILDKFKPSYWYNKKY
jgi:hypothetical protein